MSSSLSFLAHPWFWRSLRLVAIAYGTLCVYGWFLSDRQIFLPPDATYGPDPQIQSLTLPSQYHNKPETLALYSAPNPATPWVLLYSHGNAEDLGMIRDTLDTFHKAGYSVIAYDYRGYGQSHGPRPTERRTYQDIEVVYQHLVNDLKIAPNRIVLHGRSLGGGPSVYLASRHPVAGLILESTFVDTFRVITRIPLVPFSKFPSLGRMPQVHCPVLVIHGTQDRTIPLWHGQTLYNAATGPKQSLWVEGADHNDVLDIAGDRYRNALQQFQHQLKSPQ